ncbi:MAG: tRNA uridine-5-carboxymethylaminomethyl(34) synthesis GTPase MnmE, partial [Sphingobacteriales bacterium]|nr:tRNA uridine-5-carboxymethylaminomethyl(34) synthesis GTPase MnmE [Sphingobacteriales bacterium]
MNNKLSGWQDTIVALATAPGVAAIGVIRISGKEAYPIISKMFHAKNIFDQPSHTIHLGLLKDGQEIIDEVLLSLFKGPKSYTGEDTIEISGHGSPYIQQQIINACIKYGARLAKPGEFTQRAFLNGKLDLTQAESVADLIASNTKASQKTALQNIRGGFSHQLKNMREQLIKFASLIELELDFATEDVEFADRTQFYSLIQEIEIATQQLINSFQLGNVIKNGVSVAIIGKPNAGKSTLLNCLLNEDRAIVSEIAGTTRDTIEETLNINGVLFRLIDTAGIRTQSLDVIENIGIEKSLEKMRSADVVLYIFDKQTESVESLKLQIEIFKEAGIKYILVGNKSEIGISEIDFTGEIFSISAKENLGIEKLKEALYQSTVNNAVNTDNTIVTNSRH